MALVLLAGAEEAVGVVEPIQDTEHSVTLVKPSCVCL